MDQSDLHAVDDDESPMMKNIKGATMGFAARTIWGTIVATWHDVPHVVHHVALPGLVRTLRMCGNYGLTFGALGGLYRGVEKLVQKRRMKRDYINCLAGAFVADTTVYGNRELHKNKLKKKKIVLETREPNLEDFDDVFEEFISDNTINGPLKFILFLADKNPVTQVSWSNDCNAAESVITQRFKAANIDIALLKVYVGGQITWDDQYHRFKINRKFRLKGVPTLIRWEFGGITGRLEFYEVIEVSKIDALLSNN